MKFVGILISLSALAHVTYAQAGLDSIIIETYYIADSNDASAPEFALPDGSVTYRVYVDLAPGWELQAMFGATNGSTGEVDTLIIRATQPFFNNEDRGRIFGYLIPAANVDENTVAVDSWFSTGRSSSQSEGVLKPEDTNGGAPAFPNLDGLLQNDDPEAGIPISMSDGNIPSTLTSTWTLVGITTADLTAFDNVDLAGDELVVMDGAFTSFTTPLHGPNTNNRVLIGQFTTAGNFSGQLNLQLRHSGTGQIQQWVAETPGASQFTHPSLKWGGNTPPIVKITEPGNGDYFLSGDTIHLEAEATDSDGMVTQVRFLLNGVSLGIDNTAPYTLPVVATVSGVMHAIATDNTGSVVTSSPVYIEVNPYIAQEVDAFCNVDRICIPLVVVGEGIINVTDIDFAMTFDNSLVVPTGTIYKSGDLLDIGYFQTDHFIDLLQGEISVSISIALGAPPGSTFAGAGQIICVEFEKRPAFEAVDTTSFTVPFLQETFFGGEIVQRDSIPSTRFITKRNTSYGGSLSFWIDNSPVQYDTNNPETYLVTSINAKEASCTSTDTIVVYPDLNGAFWHDLNDGLYLSIQRDIAATTDVQPVVNSFDAFLIRKVLLDHPDFIPNVYQMIAMDVNRDGVISAGDVSQLNQRSLLILDEFRQAWNYDPLGNPLQDYQPSKDWQFVAASTILLDPAYARSNVYPEDDGVGYSKFRVPLPPLCNWTGIDFMPFSCHETQIETYTGILMGDVNGNYRYLEPDGLLK